MKNRGASAHENTSQHKTKIGTTRIMAPTVITVFEYEASSPMSRRRDSASMLEEKSSLSEVDIAEVDIADYPLLPAVTFTYVS